MSARPDDVPAPLAARMADALAGAQLQDAGACAEAGLAALRRALAAGDERSAALDLLTADALITAACVRAATDGLPDALSPERFAALLEAP